MSKARIPTQRSRAKAQEHPRNIPGTPRAPWRHRGHRTKSLKHVRQQGGPKAASGGGSTPIGGAEERENSAQLLQRFVQLAGAGNADIVVIPTASQMRSTGPRCELIATALRRAGITFSDEPDEHAAALALLAWAQPGDVVVLPVHTAAVRERLAVFLER